uniref:Peptidase S1 domain-containing protein n=1 Tax=Megaselia scalaris TaxID=36166 RepID=T1GE16_MEGSC
MAQKISRTSRDGTHICNGAIIHHRLILTTADCLFLDIKPEVVQQVSPKNLYITAGSNSIDLEVVTRDVESFEIPREFDFDRLENDIAILRMNKSLPLGFRNDMKWIMIDDSFNLTNAQVLINFYNRNTKRPEISKSEMLQILPNSECSDEIVYKDSRLEDICSTYSLPRSSYCDITRHNLEISAERGSGLICKQGHLIGLLSQIIPPTSDEIAKIYCSQIDKVHAYYTLVAKHIIWIYTKLTAELALETNDPYYIAAPYTNFVSAEPIVQTNNSELYDPSSSADQFENSTKTTDFYIILNFFSNSSNNLNINFMILFLSTSLTLLFSY